MVTRREVQREATREEIKAIARQQMRLHGTAGLSLRGIAREMGLTVTALYRYYENLDALITALILDGFNAMADALDDADRDYPQDACRERMNAVLLMYRRWALDHSIDFQLLYGNPIPGYEAPAEQTRAAAARSWDAIVRILLDAQALGRLSVVPDDAQIDPVIRDHLHAVFPDIPMSVAYTAAVGWTRIHGVVMLEIFDHLPPVVGDVDVFYQQQIDALFDAFQMT